MVGMTLWRWCLAVLLRCALAAAEDSSGLREIPLRTHTLQVPYLDSSMQSRWFDFGGDTVIRTDRYIRLTGELGSRTGWIFSRVPLTATNWEIEVEFKITGEGTLYGDGMAMFLTKQRAQTGPVFGFMDRFEGLGIFIDTYKNNRPGVVFPYVMAMLGDGSTSYDKDNDGKANELAGCSARGLRNSQVPTKLRVTYFQDRELKVQLQYKEVDKWDDCFTIPSVKIPSVAYLGFSAETGELSDNHDVMSISTKNLYNFQPADYSRGDKKPQAGRKKQKGGGGGGGWGWFFFKVFLFAALVGGSYVGYTAYRTSTDRSRF